MTIYYNSKTDLLYIRIEEATQQVINKRVTEDIVLDIGKDDKIVGIVILDASKHVNLKSLMPIEYETTVWKIMLVYKILSIFINIIGVFIAVSLVVIIPLFITVPILWLPVFLLIAVVLYTWFSNKFRQKVLIRKENVNHSLRDWIKVNGYVAIVFSLLNIPSIINLIRNPASYAEATKEFAKQFGQAGKQNFNVQNIQVLTYVMLIYFIALFVHVSWTFALLRKNKEYFQ